jgi:hypothetical protein
LLIAASPLHIQTIFCFIAGVGLQLYNYVTFDKFNWSLVKQKVDFTKPGELTFTLIPNLDTAYDVTLFYKKLIPEKNQKFVDANLWYDVKVFQGDQQIWTKSGRGLVASKVARKGTEVTLGQFKLEKNEIYRMIFNIKEETQHTDKKIELAVVTNSRTFNKYFYKASAYKVFGYFMFISSFVFFMGFIVFPHDNKEGRKGPSFTSVG